MRSQRQLRVGEEIRHSLATILMRGDIPWPNAFVPPHITVTEVQISPDLKNATVFIMPLGGAYLEKTVKSMNEIVGHFRHALAETVELRYVPKLKFLPDESFAYAERINKILHDPRVQKDLHDKNSEEE